MCFLSNNLRIFSHGVGNEEGITIEASKNPNRSLLVSSALEKINYWTNVWNLLKIFLISLFELLPKLPERSSKCYPANTQYYRGRFGSHTVYRIKWWKSCFHYNIHSILINSNSYVVFLLHMSLSKFSRNELLNASKCDCEYWTEILRSTFRNSVYEWATNCI